MRQAVVMMREIQAKRQREKDKKKESDQAAAEEKKRKNWTNLSNYKFW